MVKYNGFAPVVLFVYNRLDHTKKTVEALKENVLAKESVLHIYSDGPKNENAVRSVSAVRNYIKKIDGFKQIVVIERELNFGLAQSIVEGVTSVVNKYGKIIVLEDDLVTSPHFLTYMNKALDKYQDSKQVFSITAYSWTDDIVDIPDTYFLTLTSSWSWATWHDRWAYFSNDSELLKNALGEKGFARRFNYNNSYDYVKIAKLQLNNKVNSWAIMWYFSVFQQNGLTLYPAKKLVKNIGHDGSGTHTHVQKTERLTVNPLPVLTDLLYESEAIIHQVQKILKKENLIRYKINITGKLKCLVKNYLSNTLISRVLKYKNGLSLFFRKRPYGKNSYVDKTVQILGVKSVAVGENSIISEGCWFNVNKKKIGKKNIVIGDNCYIGKKNFFSSGDRIILNDYCMTGLDCKFLGSDHKFDDPFRPYISTGTTAENIVTLGVNVWLGASVIVIGNVSIGHGSIVGAGAVVTKDIPPFSIVVGSPAKVIRRFDFKINEWIKVNSYNKESDTFIPDEVEYLNILKNKQPRIFLPLQASSRAFGDML